MGKAMLGIAARLIVGTVLGVLFIAAVAFALAADALDRNGKERRDGTVKTSPESLQRATHPLVRART